MGQHSRLTYLHTVYSAEPLTASDSPLFGSVVRSFVLYRGFPGSMQEYFQLRITFVTAWCRKMGARPEYDISFT